MLEARCTIVVIACLIRRALPTRRSPHLQPQRWKDRQFTDSATGRCVSQRGQTPALHAKPCVRQRQI
ncbi:hypothetical protein VDQ74_00840 [Xanthomonas campestris pv. campestris]|nr:hypothetical protein [Xanthomonas campestris pv. campestris]